MFKEKWLRQDNSNLILKVEFLKLNSNKEVYSVEETKIIHKLEHLEEVDCLVLLLLNNLEVYLELNLVLVGSLASRNKLNLDSLEVFLDKLHRLLLEVYWVILLMVVDYSGNRLRLHNQVGYLEEMALDNQQLHQLEEGYLEINNLNKLKLEVFSGDNPLNPLKAGCLELSQVYLLVDYLEVQHLHLL